MTHIQELIETVNKADSADSLLTAVENLAEARRIEAIPTLVEVLGYNNPGAAVAAVDGLIALDELSVPYLMKNIDGYNYGARAWATRVFAGIGDPATLDILLKAAVSDFSQSVRRSASAGLGKIRWSKLPPEKILPTQKEVLKTLFLVTQDGEWIVRYAGVVGLQSLAQGVDSSMVTEIINKLNLMMATEEEIAVSARIKLALSKL